MIQCEICKQQVHIMELHLGEAHNMPLPEYRSQYPDAPLFSPTALELLQEIQDGRENKRVEYPIHKTFNLPRPSSKTSIKTITGWEKPHPSTPTLDPDYVFNKDSLSLVLCLIENQNERLLFTGPTGSGKTSLPEQVAARLNLPVSRFSCDSDVTRENFVGQWTLRDGATSFQYGVLPEAMKSGKLLILDEWDTLNPAVAMLLQPVLEESGKLLISETNEVIMPHPDFRIIATSNTIGMGDETGLYCGTQPQNYAQLNRFTIVEYVDYPDAAVERKILAAKTGIDDPGIIEKFIECATLIRSAFKKGEIMGTMSTRQIVNIARKYLAFGSIPMAYRIAYMNTLNIQDRQFAAEITMRVWGE